MPRYDKFTVTIASQNKIYNLLLILVLVEDVERKNSIAADSGWVEWRMFKTRRDMNTFAIFICRYLLHLQGSV